MFLICLCFMFFDAVLFDAFFIYICCAFGFAVLFFQFCYLFMVVFLVLCCCCLLDLLCYSILLLAQFALLMCFPLVHHCTVSIQGHVYVGMRVPKRHCVRVCMCACACTSISLGFIAVPGAMLPVWLVLTNC